MPNYLNRIVGEGTEAADQLLANPLNWRVHGVGQKGAMREILKEVGWLQRVIVNVQTGHLIDGHMRVMLADERGEKEVPVVYVDLSPDEEALVLATLDPIAAMAKTDSDKMLELLSGLKPVDDALTHVLNATAAGTGSVFTADGLESNKIVPLDSLRPTKKPDMIYTFAQSDGSCCMAYDAGLYYGSRTVKSVVCERHPVTFMDNEWKDYDHNVHLEVVAKHRPRYSTVLDVLTKGQCELMGLPYVPLDQILKWAEELEQYADNVIVIPKYDCIDEIPEKYMLGYSVPSSYGGTPLAFDRFAGRRVHLLGGSVRAQYYLWAKYPDEVVSIDTNYVHLVAKYAQVAGTDIHYKNGGLTSPIPDRREFTVTDIGIMKAPNHLYVAFCMNVALLAATFGERERAK